MTGDAFPCPEVALQPDEAIDDNLIFRGLSTDRLERVKPNEKSYKLVCEQTGLRFCVEVTAILSQANDPIDPYRSDQALDNLHQTLNGDAGPALRHFLRYSPWLITSLNVDGGVFAVVRAVMLVRLLDLLVMLMERETLTIEQWRNTYRLLLRARFLLLARLSQAEHVHEARQYLPELDSQLRQAWRTWAQTLLQAPQDVRLLLVRYQRDVEEEGKLLLFQPEKDELWSFASAAANRPFTDQLLIGWLLPRYDVERVATVLSQLHEQAMGEPGGQSLSAKVWLLLTDMRHWIAAQWYRIPNRLRVGVHVLVVLLLVIPLVAPLVAPTLEAQWLRMGHLTWQIAFWFAVGAVLLQVFCGKIWEIQSIRYTFPRITLAISVGYLALVSSGELLTFAIRAYDHRSSLAWVTVMGSVLLAFVAIYLDARRRLDKGSLAAKRASLVLLIAATRSLTLGWLILAPAGSLLLYGSPVVEEMKHRWPGPMGLPIFPQLIFVLAPLALFIGILVQTIWEEHPLTHPV